MDRYAYDNWPDFIAALDTILDEQLPSIAYNAAPVTLQYIVSSPYLASAPSTEYSWQSAVDEVRSIIQEFAGGRVQITLRIGDRVWAICWLYSPDGSRGTIDTGKP
jgi:hypothetical protein